MKVLIDSDKKNIIGPRLKEARLQCGLTQKELSVKLETMAIYINRASISKIEQQKRVVTDFEIVSICNILRISPLWLLGLE
jgi:transcriptional regulator with XRE-family HTH domain